MKTIDKNTMGVYLTVAAGATCIGGNAMGAITWYDGRPGSTTAPADLNVGTTLKFGYADISVSTSSWFARDDANEIIFTAGTDLGVIGSSSELGNYINLSNTSVLLAGAQLSSGDFTNGYANLNFAMIDLNNDSVYEATGAFYFEAGTGNGFLVALSEIGGVGNQQISAGYADMQANSAGANLANLTVAVPEPSGIALLSLGSLGLLARRRRKSA